MSNTIEQIANQEYKYGFVTDIEADQAPPGLNEDIIRLISAKKNEPEWTPHFRLNAFPHSLTMKAPTWANINSAPIAYQPPSYHPPPSHHTPPHSLPPAAP